MQQACGKRERVAPKPAWGVQHEMARLLLLGRQWRAPPIGPAAASPPLAVPGSNAIFPPLQVRQRSMGGQSMVDLAIQVDPIQSASAAHKIAEEVTQGGSLAFTHLLPCPTL